MTRLRDDEQCYDDMLRLVRAGHNLMKYIREYSFDGIRLDSSHSAVQRFRKALDDADPWFEEDDTRRAALDHRGQP